MPALQIRNLPDDVHRKLKARAAEAGQSLSEYAGRVLRAEVEMPTLEEWWAVVQARGPAGDISSEDIVEAIRAERERR